MTLSDKLSTDSRFVVLKDGDIDTPILCLHAVTGGVEIYRPLAKAAQTDAAIIGIKIDRFNDQFNYNSLTELAEDYATACVRLIGSQQCVVLGWSMGGILAYEVCRALSSNSDMRTACVICDAFVNANRTAEFEYNVRRNKWTLFAFLIGLPHAYEGAVGFDEFMTLPDDRKLTHLGRLHDAERSKRTLKEELNIMDFYRFYSFFWEKSDAYLPSHGSFPTLFIKGNDNRNTAVEAVWKGALKSNMTTASIDCDHTSMMEEPWVSQIADAVLAHRKAHLSASSQALHQNTVFM